jgi:hypothetical protein
VKGNRGITAAGWGLILLGLAVALGCQSVTSVAVRKLTRAPMKPRSDVPVVGSYPQDIQITDLTIGIVKADLCVFDDRALVRFRIAGTLQHGQHGWRPYIKEVQINEHLPEGESDTCAPGEIVLTPVVGVKRDRQYAGEPLPFEVKVEHVVQTFQALENRYVIRCGPLERQLVLYRDKMHIPQGSHPWWSDVETMAARARSSSSA